MPVVLPVGFGIAVVHWQIIGGNRESLTTFAYDPATVDPGPNALSIDGLFTAAGQPGTPAGLGLNWSYRGISVTEMSDTGPVIANVERNVVGTGGGASPPPNWSILVRKRTLSGGRRNRGRMFLPPYLISEAQVEANGSITSPQVTALQSSWTAIFNGLQSASLPMVLLHSEAPFVPTVVTGLEVQALGSTQRRRMRG